MRRAFLLLMLAACGSHPAGQSDASPQLDAPASDATADAPRPFASDRDRLLATYLAYLQAHPGSTSNGLDGSQLATTCELWAAMQPSAQAVFLTITTRLGGAVIAADDSNMLSHVTKLYRAVGGGGATATDPGSCGGGENNRMIMSIDTALHATLVAVFGDRGAALEIADSDPGGFWRDSHDLGGPHTPFDQSDETNDGAPRGQVQYFADPTSAKANAALGRTDLEMLVDPYALEMDEDYDCLHSSNPLCTYDTYGPLCASEPPLVGVDVFEESYGVVNLAWRPSGC